MSESLVGDAVARLFASQLTRQVRDDAEAGQFPQALWQALEEAGVIHPAAAGGSALDEEAVLREAGRAAAPVPLADTMLAGWVLAEGGRPLPEGPMAVVIGEPARVPWGRNLAHAVVINGDQAGLVACAGAEAKHAVNMAGEPRDRMRLPAANDTWTVDARAVRRRGALGRAALMAGALEAALDTTLRYASDRSQFGRTLSKFQAIQQMLAQLAGEVAAAGMAVASAYRAIEAGEPDAAFLMAVAKSRTGEAASLGAKISHQVHGAIGFTHEHHLHTLTRRLWSWRDEFGSEATWQIELGRIAARQGGDGLWPFIVGV